MRISVVTSGDNWPDALAVPALVTRLRGEDHDAHGPFVTFQARLTPFTLDRLAVLDPELVLVVGGPAAVPASVVAALEGAGYTVERVEGVDREQTAVLCDEWQPNDEPEPEPPPVDYGPKVISQPAGSTAVAATAAPGGSFPLASWWPKRTYNATGPHRPRVNESITGEQGAVWNGGMVRNANGTGVQTPGKQFAVLGEGVQSGAFALRNMEIANYGDGGEQRGVFNLYSGLTYTLEDLFVHDSTGGGLTASAKDQITCRRSEWARMAISGFGGKYVRLEDTELHHNGWGTDSFGAKAGAKFWGFDGAPLPAGDAIVCLRVFAHHNDGHGLWCDGAAIGVLIDTCVSDDNNGSGYHHECSGKARIVNLSAARNKHSGVYLFTAEDVEIVGCTLAHNLYGLRYRQDPRTDIPHPGGGSWNVKNVDAHHNEIIFDVSKGEGAVELYTGASPDNWFQNPANNIKFRINTYRMTGGDWATAKPFRIDNTTYTKAQWQAFGFDVDSVFA